MRQLSPHQLKQWKEEGKDFLLVDIREGWEREATNIGGMHIPTGDIMSRLSEIPKDKDVVIYCERGIRSVIVIQRLEAMGYTNLYNLAGGIKAWHEDERSPT